MSRKKGQGQHVVPKMYLNEFTKQGDGHFFQAYKNTKKVTRAHIKDVCIVRDFYNLTAKLKQKYKNVKDNIIEIAAFKEYETNVVRLIKQFKDGKGEIKRSDFVMIIKGYVGQKYRTPFLRQQFSNEPEMRKIRDRVFEEMKEEFRQNKTSMHILANYYGYTGDEEFEKWKEEALGFGNDSHIELHLWGMMKSIDNSNDAVNQSVHTLTHMDINVLCAPQGHYFLTSDNPGMSIKNINPNKQHIYNMEYKLCHEFVFPVTSDKAIELSKPNISNFPLVTRRVLYIPINEDKIRRINEGTIILAHERVFCADEQYLNAFIVNYKQQPIGL